jgi:hypothetical protein
MPRIRTLAATCITLSIETTSTGEFDMRSLQPASRSVLEISKECTEYILNQLWEHQNITLETERVAELKQGKSKKG